MATKVYKEGYMVIVEEPLQPQRKYTLAKNCRFGFDGDTCWIIDLEDNVYIYNDLYSNMVDFQGTGLVSKEDAEEYLLGFIGSSSSESSSALVEPLYTSYLNTLDNSPVQKTQDAQNTLMITLRDLGILEKASLINVFAQDSTGGKDAAYKSFYPAGFNEATETGASSLTFDEFLGVRSADEVNRLQTGVNWVDLENVTKTDVCFVEKLTTARDSSRHMFGDNSTSSRGFFSTSNGSAGCFSVGVAHGGMNGTFIGLRRNIDASFDKIVNDVYTPKASPVGSSKANKINWIGRADTASAVPDHRVAFGYAGQYLDDAQLLGMRVAVDAYLAAIL